MIATRKADDRGRARFGWLDSRHTFSFGNYYDPKHRNFRALRVMNEDHVVPGAGFGAHPHQDMEILTYVLDGALEHRDSMGNGAVLRAGEFQRMTAGSGVVHSEVNPSTAQPVHFYQIWVSPAEKGLEPSWEQKRFDAEGRRNRMQVIAEPEPANGALRIHQDARVHLADLAPGATVTHALPHGRHAWVQAIHGQVTVNGTRLLEGDGAAVSDEDQLRIKATATSEVLLFDLA